MKKTWTALTRRVANLEKGEVVTIGKRCFWLEWCNNATGGALMIKGKRTDVHDNNEYRWGTFEELKSAAARVQNLGKGIH